MDKSFAVYIQSAGGFGLVKFGERGFYPQPASTTQADADYYNKMKGNSTAEVEAAAVCSVSYNWDVFEELVQTFSEKVK